MNERIKLLAEQASEIEDDDLLYYNPVFAEKFAELIVRECLNQCYNRGMNDRLYAGQLQAASYIEEHFGVEE